MEISREVYEWPGNVRELRNVIERPMILEDIGNLLPGHLPPEIGWLTASAVLPVPTFQLAETRVVLEEVEREFVRQAWNRRRGTRASRTALSLTRDELRWRVTKFALNHKTRG